MQQTTFALLAGAAALAAAPAAHADGEYQPFDIEIPLEVIEQRPVTIDRATDSELDLANIVQSAARATTTVQEAPAIVTVVTQDEIAERQLTSFAQIVDAVPGWMHLGAIHGQFPFPLVRGQLQSALLLHDGLSLFDPMVNVPALGRIQPVETIKRVELITGPGGVLWGANSLLGVINIITKDADDVDGVEAGLRGGHGNGDRESLRGYVMAGAPDLLGGKVKAFAHASFDSFLGPGPEMPLLLYGPTLPQPNAMNMYGPLTRADPPRSLLFNVSGKLTFGRLRLRVQVPYAERHTPLGFPGSVTRAHLPEDTARDPETGELMCPNQPPYDDPLDACSDKGRATRDNQVNYVDRYAVAEYQTRLAQGRAGIALKAYVVDFLRRMEPVGVLAPIPGLLEGGLSFMSPLESYRGGGAIDGDIELPAQLRVLYGVEAFHEWTPTNDEGSRQGEGLQTRFVGPYDLGHLPLPCPMELDASGAVTHVAGCPLTMAFAASRTVLGAYLNPQWRPTRNLILDAGGRVQVAPESMGRLSHAVTPTFGGALVYHLARDWYVKLNGTQGFRPPVFNNLVSNGESEVIDGDRNLEVETSTAGQGEINARLFKGERAIRELTFRADYSYTFVHNLIQIVAGRYKNTADRGIHSVELLGKLYLQGGHRIELSYSVLKVLTEDFGAHRGLPEHWFNLGAVLNLVDRRLTATGALRVVAATEDPNRLVEHRNLAYDGLGHVIDRESGIATTATVSSSELVFDRLPPIAELSLGLSWRASDHLELSAAVQNAFNARTYQPDAFFSYEPRLEKLPNPNEDIRAYLGAAYRY